MSVKKLLEFKVKVTILLSTYNGSKYLREQLDSLLAQSYSNIEIIARDDGSSDEMLQILRSYNIQFMPIVENLGAKGSFSTLLDFALSHTQADYFMFCDQDDVWNSDKVEKTLAKMKSMEKEFGNFPLLVHTDLEIVDVSLKTIEPSMWAYEYNFPYKNSLSRLLMQNTVTGCTVMINRALAKKCLNIPDTAVMHDWWVGLVASHFGKIGYVEEATIKYRQHGKNSIGVSAFKVNVAQHVLGLIYGGVFRDKDYIKQLQVNIDQANAFLQVFHKELDDKTKDMLIDFTSLEIKSFWQRRLIILKHKLLRQGFLRNIGLFLKI